MTYISHYGKPIDLLFLSIFVALAREQAHCCPFLTDKVRIFFIKRWKKLGLRVKDGWKGVYIPPESAFSFYRKND